MIIYSYILYNKHLWLLLWMIKKNKKEKNGQFAKYIGVNVLVLFYLIYNMK